MAAGTYPTDNPNTPTAAALADAREADRVAVAGDMHADGDFAAQVIRRAHDAQIRHIWQVGDFGWWPRAGFGRNFLGRLERMLQERDMWLWFCDGNHEDHHTLPHDTADTPTQVAERIIWVPRGGVVPFGGKDGPGSQHVMFFGGAVSVDQHRRTPGHDWFPEETANREQWGRAFRARAVHTVVSHDTPHGVDLDLDPIWPEQYIRQAEAHRSTITGLCDALEPQQWFGGHYHQRRTGRRGHTRLNVLDCNHHSRPGAGAIIWDALVGTHTPLV